MPSDQCIDATAYLTSKGITLSGVSAGATVRVCNAEPNGPGLNDIVPSSPPNVLNEFSGILPESMTLNFCAPLTSVSFTRTATTSDSTTSVWMAMAYNAQGTQVGQTIGESSILVDPPAQRFTISGTGITSVTFNSSAEGFAAFSGPAIDDLTLVAGCQVDVCGSTGGMPTCPCMPGTSSVGCMSLSFGTKPGWPPETSMDATFTPYGGVPLVDAAQTCGYTGFNWQQQVVHVPTPSPYLEIGLNGGLPIPLTTPPKFFDPPPRGYYFPNNPDTSYPFYYYPDAGGSPVLNSIVCNFIELEGGAPPASIPVNAVCFHDAPADSCLQGGNPNLQAAHCGGGSAQPGDALIFDTALVGVSSAFPSGQVITQWTWLDNFNGTSDGFIVTLSNPGLVDPGSGTGGITITSINGTPLPPPGVPSSGTTCNGTFTGIFAGDLTVSNGQTCILDGSGVTGNVTQNGGSLVLNNASVGGNVQVQGGGTFSIGPSTAIDGNLQVQNIPAGAVQNQVCGSTVKGDLQFQNNGTAVQIGSGSASCAGNAIGGNLTVQNNTAAATVVGNTVGNNLTVQSNSAATIVVGNTVTGNLQDQSNTASTQVSNNMVKQNLQCQNNSSITGGGNTAKQKQGQCAAF